MRFRKTNRHGKTLGSPTAWLDAWCRVPAYRAVGPGRWQRSERSINGGWIGGNELQLPSLKLTARFTREKCGFPNSECLWKKGTGCLASILTLFFLAGGRGVFNLSNAMEMFPSLTNQELSARSQVGCNTWIQFNKRSSFEKGKASSKQPIFVKYKNTGSIFWSVIQKIRCYHLIFVLSWWVFWRFAIRSLAMTRQMRNVTIVRMTRRINYVSLPKSTLRFLR